MPAVGELWWLPGSPWSVRVRWTMAICGITANLRPYSPLVDQFALWFRLGFPLSGPPVAVPVLFPNARGARPVRSGDAIARRAAAAAGLESKLFPQDRDAEIKKVVELSGIILKYSRGVTNSFMTDNLDSAVKLFLPRDAQNRFYSKPFLRFVLWFFKRKYPATSREEAVAALDAFRAHLRKGSGYMCGNSFTFADVSAACAIFFGDKYAKDLPFSMKLAQEYPDLVEWRQKMIAENFPGDTSEIFSFKFAGITPQ